jgi:hypothetical protein
MKTLLKSAAVAAALTLVSAALPALAHDHSYYGGQPSVGFGLFWSAPVYRHAPAYSYGARHYYAPQWRHRNRHHDWRRRGNNHRQFRGDFGGRQQFHR